MNKEEAIKKLCNEYPSASVLREKNPEISDLLFGEFADDERFNVYEFPTGIVVSRRLIQKSEIDPTVGFIYPGTRDLNPETYEFNTGRNRETMTVLDGCLYAMVDRGQLSTLQRYASIIAPANTTLKLTAPDDVFYICQYKPKK